MKSPSRRRQGTRKHSEEVRKAMSENRMGENNSFYGKTFSEESLIKLREHAKNRDYLPRPGISVEITDLENNLTQTYSSIRDAAESLNVNVGALLVREKRGVKTPYRGRYIINIKRP
jgi:group I intron endonuclease